LDVPVAGFGQSDLWQLAGQRSYERGEQYIGAVMDLRDVHDGVRATVQGSEPYQVQLSWANGELIGDCSCPMGSEGVFCKHCVAVGLVLVDEAESGDGDEDGVVDGESDAPLSEDDLRDYVESLDHGALVDLLCEHAASDDTLHLKLVLRAAGDRDNPDLELLRRQIYSSLRTRGRLSYEGGLDYADRAGDILDTLEDLAESGYAAAIAPLAQQMVDLLSEAIEQADELASDEIGSVSDQAADLHERAREAAQSQGAEASPGLRVVPSAAGA
jgi:uncharacterized Zn finger protein